MITTIASTVHRWLVVLILSQILLSLHALRIGLRSTMTMRWQFEDAGEAGGMGGGMGGGGGGIGGNGAKPKSLQELGIIGAEGELYFNPNKLASLDLPPSHIKKVPGLLPIFPYNGIICPGSTEWLTIMEMRFRQMFLENSRVGILHYSPTNQKVALVGTIATVKDRQFMPDGRIFVAVEGKERFFIREVADDKPYLLAHTTKFQEFTNNGPKITDLEYELSYRVRINMQMIQWLYPNRNFSMNNKVLQNFPPPMDPTRQYQRVFAHLPDENVLQRRSDFVFGIINMLQITPATKLALLQDPVLESRMRRVYKLLTTASEFLEKELRKKGIRSTAQIEDMKTLTRYVMDDLDRARYQSILEQQTFDVSTISTTTSNTVNPTSATSTSNAGDASSINTSMYSTVRDGGDTVSSSTSTTSTSTTNTEAIVDAEIISNSSSNTNNSSGAKDTNIGSNSQKKMDSTNNNNNNSSNNLNDNSSKNTNNQGAVLFGDDDKNPWVQRAIRM